MSTSKEPNTIKMPQIIFSCVGIAPYKITPTAGYQISREWLAWSIICSIILIPTNLYMFVTSNMYEYSMVIMVFKVIGWLSRILSLIFVLLLIIGRTRQIINLLNKILAFDRTIAVYGGQVEFPMYCKIAINIGILGLVGLSVFAYFDHRSMTSWNRFLPKFATFASFLIVRMFLLYYSVLALALLLRFRAINTLFKLTTTNNFKPIRQDLTSVQKSTVVDVLNIVSYLYHRLWIITEEFNRIFSWVLLTAITHSVLWMLVNLLFFINYLTNYGEGEIVKSPGGIIIHGTVVLCMICSCMAVQTETDNTKEILYDLSPDSELHSIKATYFAMLLAHEEVRFSAGIFDMNGSVISSIVATVSTYLVIILQFETKSARH